MKVTSKIVDANAGLRSVTCTVGPATTRLVLRQLHLLWNLVHMSPFVFVLHLGVRCCTPHTPIRGGLLFVPVCVCVCMSVKV